MKLIGKFAMTLFGLAMITSIVEAVPQISVLSEIELDLNGGPQGFTLDVANIGTGDNLIVSAASFGEDPHFQVSTVPDPIIPNDSDIIEFVFNPLGERGLFSATLTITSNDPNEGTTDVLVTGAIHDPMFSASTTVNVTQTGSNVITVLNTGATQTLNISSARTEGSNTSFFRLRSWPFFGIPPGGSGAISFDFLPGDAVGIFTARFVVFSDDPIVNPFTIDLRAVVGEESVLQVIDTHFSADGESLAITWSSTAATNYAIDRSTDLTEWNQIEGSEPSTGTTTTFTDSDLPDNTTRLYYRVRVASP